MIPRCLSVCLSVRLCTLFPFSSSLLETLGQIQSNLTQSIPGWRGFNFKFNLAWHLTLIWVNGCTNKQTHPYSGEIMASFNQPACMIVALLKLICCKEMSLRWAVRPSGFCWLFSLSTDRRVSCKDLGTGDCEGWLYKKREKHGFMASHWVKRWCVIKQYNMYFYRDPEVRRTTLGRVTSYMYIPHPRLRKKLGSLL